MQTTIACAVAIQSKYKRTRTSQTASRERQRSGRPIPLRDVQKKAYFNRLAKKLNQLNIDDPVRIKNKVWDRLGQVTALCDQPISYKVQLDNGRILKRNRKFLRKGAVGEQNDVNVGRRVASKVNGDRDFEIVSNRSEHLENNMQRHTSEMHSTNTNENTVTSRQHPTSNENVGINIMPRRSTREFRPPAYLKDYVRS